MFDLALDLTFTLVTAAAVLNLVRLLRGPTVLDRIVALDTLYVNAVALLIVMGIRADSKVHFEAALLIALMGFVGTVALAKYMLRGDVIE